jgi:serine/threonine protein kinase/Tol biopolymer transport system component
MTPERWQQIEQLLHAALERGPAERAALLELECATDPDLREEVESLLSSAEQTDGFLGANAAADGAVLLADDQPADALPGSRIGPYSIEKRIGAGGMGEVYLAEDVRLGRKVALKLLEPSLTGDSQSRLRFMREARLASTLDHPNICTVHEVGETGGRPFIAMQFVEGETLRKAIGGRPKSLESVLSISLQVADALTAAHIRGIIHRDIKTGNIMVTPRGQVKVLDFGLAKLLERTEGEAESHMTISGVVMGTPASMSPEQARGEEVDRRSDIFSFGIVLYEMATGHAPFGGRSKADLISALLNKPQTPAAEVNQEISARLSAVIDRMLAKEPGDRYQSMPELLTDLRQVVGEVGGMDRLFSFSDPEAMIPLVPPQRLNLARAIAPSVAPKRLSRRVALALGGLLLFVVVAAAGNGFWSKLTERKQNRPVSVPFAQAASKQLTTKGKVGWAALSADGKFYAYVLIERDSRQESLWLGQTDASNDIQLRPPAGEYKGLAFSPDGKFLYFSLKDESQSGLFKMPLLGGRSEKLLYDLDTSFSLSPDGSQIAFLRPVKETNAPTTLVIANLDGGPERELLQRPAETSFSLNCMAWSPDGSKIAVAAVSDSNRAARELFVVRTTDGQVEQLTTSEWSRISNVVWQGDGQGLVIVATNKGETFRHLWQVDYPAGIPHRLSRDIDEYGAALSLSSVANSLVAVQIKRESNIWIGPADDLSKAQQVTFSSINGIYGWEGIDWVPDGGIVFTAGIDRSLAIYSMDLAGGNIKQMTSSGFKDQRPRITPDGNFIVFQSNRSNAIEIWRVRRDGTELTQLTTGGNNSSPDLTSDGKWVFYTAISNGKSFVWRVSIQGGKPEQVTTIDSYHPCVSPDGKLLAYTYETEAGGPFKIAILNLADGTLAKLFDVPRFASFNGGVRWSPDGQTLIYRDRGKGLWQQALSGGQPHKLEGIPDQEIIRFEWSRDGKQFAFVRGRIIADVVLLRDVR